MAAADYMLHEKVFSGDIDEVRELLKTEDPTRKDMHGNTALHLACMLGHQDIITLLLDRGAPIKVKNSLGWSPMAEAISYGDRQIIMTMLKAMKQQSHEMLEKRRPTLIKGLENIDDFYLELKWDFHSWVPLVSRILPSDVCRIHKRGSCIRMDTTLVDFNEMKWERGDITFLFMGERKNSLVVMDNKFKVFQNLRHKETEDDINNEVDMMMSSDIVAASLSTKHVTFTRIRSGWVFREDKSEMVGKYPANCYTIHGLTLESRKRREHLSEEDLRKNKAVLENLTKGHLIDNLTENQRRQSLPPPQTPTATWDIYSGTPPGKPLPVGRPIISKHNSKSFKASVAMCEDFPMNIDMLLNILEIIAPFKQFSKLREFLLHKLPPGFPVKIEIPVFPTVTAKVTFQEFAWRSKMAADIFMIPDDYHEDPLHFPDL